MLKIRLQGTKNDIRWFVRLLQRDKRFDVNNVSTFFDNVGTDKYKRVYAEVSRKNRKYEAVKKVLDTKYAGLSEEVRKNIYDQFVKIYERKI